jgi:dipeptidyl aminopeptidase/acylaminoacyl peptidase
MPTMNRQALRSTFLLFIFVLLFAAIPATNLVAADKHPFGLDDYAALRRARTVAVSPDGKSVLFQVSHDGEKGPTKHEWRLIEASGENNRKLELPESFQPSGFTKEADALYGLYEVEKKNQLAIIPLGAGKPTRIIALPNGIREITISPDGSSFALTADPRSVDALNEVRHVIENDPAGVYVAGVSNAQGAWWCPELKDVTDVAWSADSSQLAVVTQFQKIGHHDARAAVWICSAGGARKISEIANSVSGIAWANGGKDLAFSSTTTDVLTPEHLWTVPVSGGTAVDQTPKLDGTIPVLANDVHGTVWVVMLKGTKTELYSYRDGKLQPAYSWPGGIVTSLPAFSPFASAPDVLAFTVSDPSHVTNVAVARGSELQKITH